MPSPYESAEINFFGVRIRPQIYAPILTLLSLAFQISWLTHEISGQNRQIRSKIWPLSYPKGTIYGEPLNEILKIIYHYLDTSVTSVLSGSK